MKLPILVILLFALTFCTNKKNKNKGNVVDANELGITEFAINKEIHNFGELISGEIVIYSFTITNFGENSLAISNIVEDCGCLGIKTPEKPIKPGNEGKIEVTFDSTGLFGKQFKAFSFETNTIEQRKELAITANVINKDIQYKQ